MQWLTGLVGELGRMGPLGAVLFVLLYVAASITLAPSFFLTLAAGAMFGAVWGAVLVTIGTCLGATAAYGVAIRLTDTRLLRRLDREPRVIVVRSAVAHDSAWMQFLLRLSPLIPFVLLNYALGLARVRFKDFVVALVGMLPAIVVYTYYGKVIGDVAKVAAGVAPPRGPSYYVLLGAGLIATVAVSTLIARKARETFERQQRLD